MGQRFKLTSPNYKTLKAQEKIFTLLDIVMISPKTPKACAAKKKIDTMVKLMSHIYVHTYIHIYTYMYMHVLY